MKKEFNGKISAIVDEAKDCKRLVIHLQEQLSFIPGQYCMLALPNEKDIKRAFSIVSIEKNDITFCIKENKDFTKKLFECKNGDEIVVFGPYGRFTLSEKNKDLTFIAGGIGITPLYCMICDLVKNSSKKINLFYSSKKREDTCLLKEIEAITCENLKKHISFTREGDSRITIDEMKKQVPELKNNIIYLCGPSVMMSVLKEDLLKEGIEEENIRQEEF